MKKQENEKPKPGKLNYEGNSNLKKEVDKKVEQVATGRVTNKKKSLGKKISDTFTGEDAQSVGSHLLFNVVIPAVKNTVSDLVTEGVQRLLFGDNRPVNPHSISNNKYTSYNRFSKNNRPPVNPIRGGYSRNSYNLVELLFDRREDAELVIEQLCTFIQNHGVASVSDYYELSGSRAEFTDENWGWHNLVGVGVRQTREGYTISLPRPIPITY